MDLVPKEPLEKEKKGNLHIFMLDMLIRRFMSKLNPRNYIKVLKEYLLYADMPT
jgi:hypothetical protein